MKLDEVILGTGNYECVENGNRVSIDRDGGSLWCHYGKTYKQLAPEYQTYKKYIKAYNALKRIPKDRKEYLEFKKEIEDEFIRSYYETRLRKINSYELLEELYNLFGSDIILLSSEEIFTFTHRRLLVDYIELETGIYTPEVTMSEGGRVRSLIPNSYKDRIKKVIDED